MTDEEIAEMWRRVANAKLEDEAGGSTFGTDYWHDVSALLAERAALLAEVEQWRAIGRPLADMDTLAYEYDDGSDQRCTLCYGAEPGQHVWDYHEWKHTADCPVTKTRALLEGKQP